MISSIVKFLCVSITSITVGAGLGALDAWSMTVRLERQYQLVMTEAGPVVGALIGLALGWVAYYGIFKQQIKYEVFCAVVTTTAIATVVTGLLLHLLTDTGGWLSIFFGIAVFLVSSFKLRRTVSETS